MHTWKNIKKSYKKKQKQKKQHKILAPTWNVQFESLAGSYSVAVYHKKHKPVTSNPPIRIYVNEIENGTTFKIKTENHLEPLMPQTVKALGSTGGKISKYENGEDVPHLQIIWSSISSL